MFAFKPCHAGYYALRPGELPSWVFAGAATASERRVPRAVEVGIASKERVTRVLSPAVASERRVTRSPCRIWALDGAGHPLFGSARKQKQRVTRSFSRVKRVFGAGYPLFWRDES
jgi:hypothetical protein